MHGALRIFDGPQVVDGRLDVKNGAFVELFLTKCCQSNRLLQNRGVGLRKSEA